MKKTKEEIGFLKKACELTCKRMNACLEGFLKFSTEQDVKDFLEKDLPKDVTLAFPTIVASGKNASEPHYDGGEGLREGFCVIDFGLAYKKYCADITRTVYIGNPSEEEKWIYHYLLKEHHRMIKQVRPGRSLRSIDKWFRRRLGGRRRLFIHALGHAVGKEIHERVLKKMDASEVITIEPGLYVKGVFGIRIEDDILVGGGNLTNSVTRKLLIYSKPRL